MNVGHGAFLHAWPTKEVALLFWGSPTTCASVGCLVLDRVNLAVWIPRLLIYPSHFAPSRISTAYIVVTIGYQDQLYRRHQQTSPSVVYERALGVEVRIQQGFSALPQKWIGILPLHPCKAFSTQKSLDHPPGRRYWAPAPMPSRAVLHLHCWISNAYLWTEVSTTCMCWMRWRLRGSVVLLHIYRPGAKAWKYILDEFF